jgi:hypothetical protein
MLDYLDTNLIPTRFSSLLASDCCTLIAGADQGQGAGAHGFKLQQ